MKKKILLCILNNESVTIQDVTHQETVKSVSLTQIYKKYI